MLLYVMCAVSLIYCCATCFQDGCTALMFACQGGHVDIARMLVSEYNANIEIQDKVMAISRSQLRASV